MICIPATVYINYSLYRPHIGHHGRAEIKVKHSALKLTALVTRKADGHPVMKVTNCEVDLHLSIKVHGSGRFVIMCMLVWQ